MTVTVNDASLMKYGPHVFPELSLEVPPEAHALIDVAIWISSGMGELLASEKFLKSTPTWMPALPFTTDVVEVLENDPEMIFVSLVPL